MRWKWHLKPPPRSSYGYRLERCGSRYNSHAFLNVVMNLWFSENVGNFLTCWWNRVYSAKWSWLVDGFTFFTHHKMYKHKSALSQHVLALKQPMNEVDGKINATSIIPLTITIQMIPNSQFEPMNSPPSCKISNVLAVTFLSFSAISWFSKVVWSS